VPVHEVPVPKVPAHEMPAHEVLAHEVLAHGAHAHPAIPVAHGRRRVTCSVAIVSEQNLPTLASFDRPRLGSYNDIDEAYLEVWL
jgi:hypothetical protein